MKLGKVEQYMHEKYQSQGCILLNLIDPPDQTPEEAGRIAKQSEEGGADVILIGGSASAQGEILEQTIKAIKDRVSLPVLLFPGNIGTTSPNADAIYFMSLMNSRNPYWISQAQALGAPIVKKYGTEAIPTAYLVLEPGEAVGWIGDVNPLPRSKPYIAAQYALAAEMLGMRVVLTDSGSGAPSPPDGSFISYVKKALSPETLYIYAGGVKNPDQAANIIKAGANGVHVGTAFENQRDVKDKVRKFSEAMRREGKKHL
jgi:phosphoglycerol geranylgeranyltransferase